MSLALDGSFALQRFKCSNAVELRNGIMFDFYPGLPHMYVVRYCGEIRRYCMSVWEHFTSYLL